MKKQVTWEYVGTISAMGQAFDEYISQDGKLCKQVWLDGYEEIFEIE